MNAIAEKMKDKGVEPRDVRLNIAIAEFMNNGGTEARAIALVKSAYERARQGHAGSSDKAADELPTPRAPNDSDKGHSPGADKARRKTPASLSPNDDAEGHAPDADKATRLLPTASSTNGSEGHTSFADKATVHIPTASGRAAVMRAATNIARSVLDSFKLRDGRAIGSIAFCELEGLRFENAREAAVIRQIQRHYANAPGDALVRDLIKEDDLNRFIQKAAEVAEF
ncbi:hypothetical protein ACLB6G_20480 [Zhengella sp. ZM62]|uniref:hypothetical protein n=1 Tax=Zhengella sedimenti TaxID=3390035 RepID=UPI00397706A8